ncbi:MAG: TonB-dependent receptor plug domain-containing protein, partial [Pseudomonadota bacterium]|nr:TonB-dependent receptor plug domain-containing protein [Pseudomonadota bacterium]
MSRSDSQLKAAHQRATKSSTKEKHYRTSLVKVLHSTLICFGVSAAMVLPCGVFAQTDTPVASVARSYDIPSGYLEAALNQFVKQAGINVSFDAAKVKGIAVQELKGSFTTQAGLNRLLVGSGLEAVPQANGYLIRKSVLADNRIAILPPVNVSAPTITGPADGYLATQAFSATRTNTPLRDVPQSITVVTKDQIRDQNMLSIADVVRYVPGVGVSQGEGNRDAVIFRGNNSTGDFFVDGLRDDAQYFRDLYNIERVEVLRGANGMIFGRGGAGGVINRVTKEAGWTPINEVSVQYGSFSHKRVAIDIGRAINDVVAFRLNAMYEHSNSFRNGVDVERGGVNPTFTIKPSAQTKIVLGGEYFTDNRVNDRGIPSAGTVTGVVESGRPADTHRSTFFGDPNRSPNSVDVKALNSLVEHAFDNGLTVRNHTRYAVYDKFYQNVFASGSATAQDATGTVNIQAYNDATERSNVFNRTDFVYALNTGPVKHELLAGVEYGRQVTDNFRNNGYFNNNFTNGGRTSSVPFFNPISGVPLTFRPDPTGIAGGPTANNHGVVDVVSVYLQDQV